MVTAVGADPLRQGAGKARLDPVRRSIPSSSPINRVRRDHRRLTALSAWNGCRGVMFVRQRAACGRLGGLTSRCPLGCRHKRRNGGQSGRKRRTIPLPRSGPEGAKRCLDRCKPGCAGATPFDIRSLGGRLPRWGCIHQPDPGL
ncbi:MAG: hypothetical protein R6W95_09955 [Desulfosarcina sp.]